MASFVQCPKGHFYDPSITSTCPYCTPESSASIDLGGFDRAVHVESSVFTAPPRDEFVPTEPVERDTHGRVRSGTVTEDDNKTTIVKKSDEKDVSKYTVGWLVCVEGPYEGKSFVLTPGYTRVGRTEGEIRLEKDKTISRVNHFRVLYDADENLFLAFGGESGNYLKVDGVKKYQGERAELKPYSELSAGSSKFLFVPFCSDSFRWKNLNET